MSWLTVFRMMHVKGRRMRSTYSFGSSCFGLGSGLSAVFLVSSGERKRIQLNDLETLPYFLVARLLFVLTDPSLLLTRWLLYGFVAARLLHFAAYFTAQTHDMRASLWTPGSLILIFMTCRTLLAALSY